MTAEGLKAIKALSAKGIPTNCTLIFSANQALLAARAGATYVSPFLGRLDDISQRGIELIETIHDMFLNYPDIETQIIAASVRNPMHVTDCALAGADIATVPYKVIEQMLHHPLTDSGSRSSRKITARCLVSDMTKKERLKLQIAACKVRMGVIESTHGAKAGHPGGSLSAADMFTYLYNKEMRVDPTNPKWENRDRFVLSKGHTAPGLYSALAYRGFFPVEDLPTLRHIDSYLQGHPNMNTVPGVDMSTGSGPGHLLCGRHGQSRQVPAQG